MTKRMLVDATHSEETRVAVVDGNRLIDYDYESKVRKQLKGSIFLAKVTRVEPSLQAAFVNFGGNRHGFLPFSEIHPDYFRIPISDREALIAEQEAEMAEREAREEAEDANDVDANENDEDDDDAAADEVEEVGGEDAINALETDTDEESDDEVNGNVAESSADDEGGEKPAAEKDAASDEKNKNDNRGRGRGRGRRGGRGRGGHDNRRAASSRKVEVVGGDSEGDRPVRPSLRRNYKIQEVIKRGQIMLIQVSKEERGNKGAAVTSYMSLPGRYCVLMPNSPRAGGVSRKIANYKDRKKMRDMLKEMQVPQGMSVILRTAGVSRTKTEVKRDLDYLMRLWDNVRALTLESSAPSVIHEEGNLIRRSIRDIYTRDIEEILVSGDEGYKLGKDFMKMMIPSHAKNVKQYKDEQIPLFHRYQVEGQINEIGTPDVTLPSGGYLVINPTEALVAVDVNSGRATKGRHIEETALKTNMEAAEEVARQLKLRDLGGLVVIDFIDMEDRRNNRKVENKLKNALSTDRARIQVGRISSLGLLELSRQRLNPSLTEAQFHRCDHCKGVGNVRTVDATAVVALRALEEEGIRERAGAVVLQVSNAVAIYILNKKRDMLADIERRYGFKVEIHVNEDLAPSGYKLEAQKDVPLSKDTEESPSSNASDSSADAKQGEKQDEDAPRRKRRRGRRGGRRRNAERTENQQQGESQAAGSDNTDGNKQESSDQPVTEVADKSSDKKEEKSDEQNKKKPAARGRKPSSRSKAADNKSDEKKDAQPSVDEADSKPKKAEKKPAEKKSAAKSTEKKVDKKAEEKPADEKKPTRGRKKKEETSTDKAPAKKEAKAPAKKKAAADKDADSSASNDSKPHKDYEVINEEPGKKKKGWWSRGD